MSTRNLRNIERTRTAAQVRGHQRAEGSLRHVAEWLRTVTERAKADRLDVIEREVAHAVAIERNAAADWLETYKDQRIEGLVLDIRHGVHTIDFEATR